MHRQPFLLVLFLMLPLPPALAAVDRDHSQALYEEALEFFRTESYAEATIQLRNALQQDADNLPARIMLGRILLQQNQPHAAIKELEKAQAMGGDENLILIPLAMAYMEVAEPEHVITGFVAEGHKPEVDGELQLLQAEAYLQLSNQKHAEELFLSAGTLLPVDPRPLLGRARIQLAKGKFDKADALIADALALAPESFDVWMFVALVQRDRGNFREALAAFEKVLALNPTSSRALTARAALWMDVGQTDKAKEDLLTVRNLDSDTLETIYLRTLLLFREGKVEEARQELRRSADEIRAIKEDYRAKLPNTTLMLGVVAFFEANYAEAIGHLRSYLSKMPNHLGALRYLTAAYLALGEPEEVIKTLKPAASTAPPNDPMMLSILAEAYGALGDARAAEQYFEAAIKLAPDAAGLGVRLAASRLDAGRPEAAISELERLTARFPDLVDAWGQLVRVRVKTGDVPAALEAVGIMLERFDGQAQVHNLAGATYLAAGDFANARLQLELARQADPDLILPHINLARLARQEGDLASAEAQYRATLEHFPGNTTAMIELTRLLLQHGEYDEAMERSAVILKQEPNLFAAHELRLDIVFASGQAPDRIRAAIYEMLKAFPEQAESELVAGRAYRLLGDAADARMHLRRAVEAAHFDGGTLYRAANEQYAIGDFSGALWTLTKAEQASPGDLGVGVLKAAVHTELGEFGKAGEALAALEEKHGERAEIMMVKGDWHMAQQQPAAAVEAYRSAYAMSPARHTLQTLFRASIAAGQREQAATLMREWLEEHPRDLASMHLFAQALMLEKRWTEAREVYEKLQASGIEDVIMLNNLAVCYQHLGDARALPAAEAAYAMAPTDPNVADTYGWILLEHDRADEALALLREAFARASTSPAIRYHIGLALSRLGRTAEATEEVEAALASAEAFSGRDDARSLLDRLRDAVKQ